MAEDTADHALQADGRDAAKRERTAALLAQWEREDRERERAALASLLHAEASR
jgi:hypothetical protein